MQVVKASDIVQKAFQASAYDMGFNVFSRCLGRLDSPQLKLSPFQRVLLLLLGSRTGDISDVTLSGNTLRKEKPCFTDYMTCRQAVSMHDVYLEPIQQCISNMIEQYMQTLFLALDCCCCFCCELPVSLHVKALYGCGQCKGFHGAYSNCHVDDAARCT